MGYFDGLTDAFFKKDSSGITIFYPSGVLGRGYVIPTEERVITTRRYLKKMNMIVIPVCLAMAFFITQGLGFISVAWIVLSLTALLAIFFAWYYGFAVQALTKDLVVSDDKFTNHDFLKSRAKSYSIFTLIVLELISLFFVLGGVLFIDPEYYKLLLGMAAVTFFGFCSVQIAKTIYLKLKSSGDV